MRSTAGRGWGRWGRRPLMLLTQGCPVPAIVAAYGLDERPIATWRACAGPHVQAVHEHLLPPGRWTWGMGKPMNSGSSCAGVRSGWRWPWLRPAGPSRETPRGVPLGCGCTAGGARGRGPRSRRCWPKPGGAAGSTPPILSAGTPRFGGAGPLGPAQPPAVAADLPGERRDMGGGDAVQLLRGASDPPTKWDRPGTVATAGPDPAIAGVWPTTCKWPPTIPTCRRAGCSQHQLYNPPTTHVTAVSCAGRTSRRTCRLLTWPSKTLASATARSRLRWPVCTGR